MPKVPTYLSDGVICTEIDSSSHIDMDIKQANIISQYHSGREKLLLSAYGFAKPSKKKRKIKRDIQEASKLLEQGQGIKFIDVLYTYMYLGYIYLALASIYCR